MSTNICGFTAARVLAVALSVAAAMMISASAPPASGASSHIGAGARQYIVPVGGANMTMFTYRPRNCADPVLLLVFHGLGRNADGYRDHARPLADRLCMLVVAPLFDKERFPTWRYQRGGIVKRGVVQPSDAWTGQVVLEIADWVRRTEGRNLDYYMLGHSAGGQFLSRVAAFVPTEARRIVIANPSTYVFPDLTTPVPYAFGGVYSAGAEEAELRRYLAVPLTIYLGQEDIGDKDRNDTPEALAQGETRYERGRNAFQVGRDLARSRGWAFNWRLVELPGVGHSARKMFAAPQAVAALRP
jgi:pimeloyl-ACP methyl ester carboxylesterase